ncbi:MAG: flagellar basal body-associated FliL family protein [Loktanella sp.]|nr:flagellar basal body-associated FliL family protein [Loktanella sp.]
MTAVADPDADRPRKSGKKPLFIGLALALLGAGGGFFVVQSGMLSGDGKTAQDANQPVAASVALTVGFVALDPLVISLPATNGRDHLRFSAQLEVPLAYVAEVAAIKPRIVDVLNGYLRAVDLAELENPAALARMRGQMLRRVQVVAGDGRISDLLIMEFVLS